MILFKVLTAEQKALIEEKKRQAAEKRKQKLSQVNSQNNPSAADLAPSNGPVEENINCASNMDVDAEVLPSATPHDDIESAPQSSQNNAYPTAVEDEQTMDTESFTLLKEKTTTSDDNLIPEDDLLELIDEEK